MTRRRKGLRLRLPMPVCPSLLVLLSFAVNAYASSFDQMAFTIDSFHLAGPDTLPRAADLDLIWDERILERKPAFGFSQLTESNFTLFQLDGQNFGQTVTYIFRPHNGQTIDDYNFVVTSTDEEVLLPEDVVRTVIEEEVSGVTYYNVTYEFDFNRFPGKTTFNVDANPTFDGATGFTSKPVDFLIPGVAIYDPVTREVLSGSENGINVDYSNFVDGVTETTPSVTQFGVFIQYPDGTSSLDRIEENKVPSLNDVEVTITDNDRGLIDYDQSTCRFDGATYTNTGTVYQPGCNLGITGTVDPEVSEWPGLFFGINPNRYAVGTTTIMVEWPGFDNDPEADEVFSTTIPITVFGDAPPVLYEVEGPEYFLPEGGQEITTTFANGGFTSTDSLREFIVTSATNEDSSFIVKPGSFIDNGATQQVTFLTAPGSSQENTFVFKVDGVEAVDLTTTNFDFKYALPPQISEVQPNQGPVEGGSTHVITGIFQGFDPSAGHSISFSNFRLGESSIVLSSRERIEFVLPPQSIIGTESVYDLQVEIGQESSPAVPFYYEVPPQVSVLVTGDVVQDSSGQYTVQNDGSFNVIAQSDSEETTYQWIISSTDVGASAPSLVGLNLTAPFLDLDATRFPVGFQYDISVTVINSLGLSETVSVSIERGEPDFGGVSIRFGGLASRTRGEPRQPVQVTADVELINPPAGVSENMTYAWSVTIGGILQQFVVTSETIERDVATSGPSRLGQEFYVTQYDLPFGPAVVTFSLNAYLTERPDLGSTISDSVQIIRGRLVASINNGQDSVRVSPAEQIVLFGSASRDIDIVERDGVPTNNGLTYDWLNCRKSLTSSFEISETCFDDVLANVGSIERFTLSGAILDAIKMSAEDATFFEITMRVRKIVNEADARESATDTIVLELEPDATTITTVSGIELTNAAGDPVDPSAVNFLDSLIVAPIAPEGATWEFRFTDPPQAFAFTREPANLYSDQSVYYSEGTSEDKPLGILAGRLEPNTAYTLTVRSISEASFDLANEASISFKTTQRPRIIFAPLTVDFGTTSTVFTATASASVSSPSLRFFFFSVNSVDQERLCLGPCNGADTINFEIKRAGLYDIIVELRDSDTQGLYASTTNFNQLNVSDLVEVGTDAIETLNVGVDTCYATSNDGCVLAGINAYIDSILTPAERQTDELEAEIVNSVRRHISYVLQLSGNSIPNSEFGKSLVETAASLSRLGSRYIAESQDVFSLLTIVQDAIERSPEANNLQGYRDSLSEFGNFSTSLAFDLDSQGSTRRRLLQQEINVVGLQSATSISNNFAEVSGRRETCGYQDSFNTAIADGIPGVDPLYATMFKYCNPDQLGTPLSLRFSDFTIRCPEILAPLDAQYSIVLTESGNYAGEAGAFDGDFETDGFTRISTEPGSLSLPEQAGCYQIRQRLSLLEEETNPQCFRLAPEVNSSYDCSDLNCYQRSVEGIETTFTNEFIIAEADTATGLYSCLRRVAQVETASPTSAPGDGESARFGAGAISGLVIGILLFILLALLVAWIIATRCFAIIAAPPPADNFEYVERDIYGRGFVIEQSAYDADGVELDEEGYEYDDGEGGIDIDEENVDADDQIEFEDEE